MSAQNRDGLSFLAREQGHVHERRKAHVQAVDSPIIGAATEFSDAVKQAIRALDGRSQRRYLRQVGSVIEAVQAGVGATCRGVEQSAVAARAPIGGCAVVVAVSGQEQA